MLKSGVASELPKTVTLNKPQNYPVFKNPSEYLQCREGTFATKSLKQKKEWRAMDRCFEKFSNVRSVCDVPCGPGRLFPYWEKRGLEIIGAELSAEMADSARQWIRKHNVPGRVETTDAFELGIQKDQVDLVASVRFLYYFDDERRIDLLNSLARFSRRYLLLQYKTTETWKGRRNASRPSVDHGGPFEKRFVSNRRIEWELARSDLNILSIETISRFSDRLFVAAEKNTV